MPIKLDPRQESLLKIFEEVTSKLETRSFFGRLLNRLRKNNDPTGIYLHGGVGRGKTVLMKIFFKKVSVSKEFVHYQNFMQLVHIKLHKLQNLSANKVIEDLAAEISNRSRVICVDEFEIKDITDAMIIMRLFKYLEKDGVFIFLTTNTMPENLYKDGLQRESFLPFIKMVDQKFLVLHLDTNKDYRLENIASFDKRLIYPINKKNVKEIKKIINDLCSPDEVNPGLLKVFGREVIFSRTHKNILFTNFNELFLQEFGYADYVNICQNYQVIILENVQEIKEDETDIIIRFINFIDNAYFYKVLLFITLESAPEEIYKKGKRLEEFKRTVSRLQEMNSQSYLKYK